MCSKTPLFNVYGFETCLAIHVFTCSHLPWYNGQVRSFVPSEVTGYIANLKSLLYDLLISLSAVDRSPSTDASFIWQTLPLPGVQPEMTAPSSGQ